MLETAFLLLLFLFCFACSLGYGLIFLIREVAWNMLYCFDVGLVFVSKAALFQKSWKSYFLKIKNKWANKQAKQKKAKRHKNELPFSNKSKIIFSYTVDIICYGAVHMKIWVFLSGYDISACCSECSCLTSPMEIVFFPGLPHFYPR